MLTTKCERKNKAVIAGEITEEVVAKFEEMLAAHDAEGEKRKARAAEKRAVKLEAEKALEEAVYAMLGEEAVTASQIKDGVEGIETAQKATVIVKRLVAAGLAVQSDIKGAKGKVKGYTRA